jgi:hypothetical protein
VCPFLASLSIIVPVVFYLALGEKAQAPLETMKEWLVVNNTVMAVILVVFGTKVLGDGISILS